MTEAPAKTTSARRWLRRLLGVLVVGVIVAIASSKLDGAKLRAGLSLLAPWHVLVVLALSLLHIGTRAFRYHRLLLACGPRDYTWSDGARIFLIGLSAAAVTPARAGDLVKVRLVAPYGLGIGVGTGLVLVERILDLVVMTVYAIALSFAVRNDALRAGATVLLVLVLVVIVLCSSKRLQARAGALLERPARRLLARRYEDVRDAARGALSTWRTVFGQPMRLAAFLAASFAIWFVEFLKLWLLLHLMGQGVALSVVASAYAASLIAGAVSALPFSEGVVGLTLVAVLVGAGGVDPSTASIAVVVDRAASTLPPIALWVLFAATRGSSAAVGAEASSFIERFGAFLERRRGLLLALWILHAFLLHWFVLGFTSWDGISYRVAPIVELAQHGHLGLEKYDTWIYQGYLPFVELVHLPFLKVFKLPGVLIGFPLVLLPLCVIAVYLCVRELTASRRAGTFGALAWLAIPTMNHQPFSGYIDFAACAFLALVVFAVVRAARAGRRWSSLGIVVLSVALFTMSRAQGMYILALLLPFVGYALYVEREGFRFRVLGWRNAALTVGAMALGAVPALTVQVGKYLRHGSPTYPYQFQVLGLKIGGGVPTASVFRDGGLQAETFAEFRRATIGAWFWPSSWPSGGFFDSRDLGGGFMLVVALALLPVFVKRASRVERWLVVGGLIVSVLARDFWLPRYAYTIVLCIAVIVGRGLLETARSSRARPLFWAAIAVVLVHLGRPLLSVAILPRGGPRLDVAGTTKAFGSDEGVIHPYPDDHARFVIVGYVANGFALPLFGRRLTNEVVHSIKVADLGDKCVGVAAADRDPGLLFVDDLDATKECARTCVIASVEQQRCLAYRLHWAEPAPAELR